MTTAAVAAPGPLTPTGEPSREAMTLNRFHIATLAFRRVKQLTNGARPRVAVDGHRPTRLAMLEVLADTISWTVE